MSSPNPVFVQSLRTFVSALPDSVRLRLSAGVGMLIVKMLSVDNPGNGQGSQVLAGLLDLADENQWLVELEANPTDRPKAPDTFDLARWYASFGFEPVEVTDDGVRMRRLPQPPVGVDALLASRSEAPRLTFEEYKKWESLPPAGVSESVDVESSRQPRP